MVDRISGPPDEAAGTVTGGDSEDRPGAAPAGRGETAPRPPGEGPESAGDALVIPPALLSELKRRLEAAYPGEGCGVLLGRLEGGERTVVRLEIAENRWAERDDRYLVDPRTLRRLLEEEERGGPRILGFYHSHPDAAPVPSETDREYAWPWYHYLIVPVVGGRAGRGRAWELSDGRFAERPLRQS